MRPDPNAFCLQILQAKSACDAKGGGQATRKVPTTAKIHPVPVLLERRIVGVPGSGGVVNKAVIGGSRVLVSDHGEDLATRGDTLLVKTRLKHGYVALASRRTKRGTAGRTACHEGIKGLKIDLDSCREARESHADLGIVRAAEDRK